MTGKRKRRTIANELPSSPRLADTREETADWVECWTLTNKDGNTSFTELWSAMDLSSSADAYTEPDTFEYAEIEGAAAEGPFREDANLYEAAAEATFAEISDRISACGKTRYPFTVTAERVATNTDTAKSVYTFLLLLSKYGPDAGPRTNEGAKLFEDVCAQALTTFLGGKTGHADAQVFGFPRRVSCDGFADALNTLCRRLGEGDGVKERPTTQDQKDGKLDVVGWKGFADGRKGKLIFFGQCATGEHWRDKRSELIATYEWCTQWMLDRPHVWPMRSFFVPHRVGDKDWLATCAAGGLLFDRCRITYHAEGLSEQTTRAINSWCKHVLSKHRAK